MIFSNKFKRKNEEALRDNAIKEAFKSKYSAFQQLLAKNNEILELMADMEEKRSGEFLFDRRYVEKNTGMIAGGVKDLVDRLNDLSGNKYGVLNERFFTIHSEIEGLLFRKNEIPVSDYTVPFDLISADMTDRLGGKNANLGEVRNRVHLPTPRGFAISAYAFKKFMEHNDFKGKFIEKLSGLSVEDLDELNKMTAHIQEMIVAAEIPDDLRDAIERELDVLSRAAADTGLPLMFSVRSSALQEDSEFSFAGQYATFLNVPAEQVLQRFKDVLASLFTPRAIFYFKTKGLNEYDMVMSVGVLRMIDARAAGVIYSRDPNNSKNTNLIINSLRGLGKSVVDGTMTPESYTVARDGELEITGKNIPVQKSMIACSPGGSVEEIRLPDNRPDAQSISDDEIRTLARYALAIEKHYAGPQDIEWAIDKKGKPYVLQARPLRIVEKETPRSIPTRVPGHTILIDKGIIASKGVGYGKVRIIRTDEDLKDFPDGAVLVARRTSPKYVSVMNKTSAIITDFGGATGHMASLTREFQVPSILDTESATSILTEGQEVTVDAYNCNVYEGKVSELIEIAGKRDEPFKDTVIFRTLQKVLKWIVPLKLIDPEGDNFRPESCETFHDITRFCHEMAMHEMFKITSAHSDEIGETRKLIAGIPLVSYLIDLGGGIKENSPKVLNPEHITSEPLRAFFRGLVASNWPQAKPVDTGGFFGMLAHTATIPEQELQLTGEKSFSFISSNYMNFLLRLGYHLSTVEAFAGDNLNDNYIRFFFKGGGAVADRRLRRVALISEVLKAMDFKVKIVDDVVDAVITKYKKNLLEERLEILGRFTAYTKQLDMVLYNDAITDFYTKDFIRKYIQKKPTPGPAKSGDIHKLG
ncbi:MAG TPA: PEP/pyruvate-binding domain-containing protein [Dissulfurispiraceae bacterium]|nr:PEP/pyruvate-binding domain-containing protein [Dissulfurispiraceae bacterium]